MVAMMVEASMCTPASNPTQTGIVRSSYFLTPPYLYQSRPLALHCRIHCLQCSPTFDPKMDSKTRRCLRRRTRLSVSDAIPDSLILALNYAIIRIHQGNRHG